MSAQEIIKLLSQPHIKRIFHQAGIQHLWLFGSYAKGTATPNSDIDLLYQYDPSYDHSLGSIFSVYGNIQDSIPYTIDLVSKDFLDQRIKKDVLSDSLRVF